MKSKLIISSSAVLAIQAFIFLLQISKHLDNCTFLHNCLHLRAMKSFGFGRFIA